jgi:GTP-binding protein
MQEPTITILGRPNVGKSTLFNRLVGKRHSIVSHVEGVTRDRIYSKIEWLGKYYNLIDTGGYIPKADDVIAKQVTFQAEIARNESDLIIFVVDGRDDITSTDRLLADIIKKSGKPCILVINKIDTLKNESLVNNFYELGLSSIVALSAQSGRQIGLLLDQIVDMLPNLEEVIFPDDLINFAIVGMPNVGKSSLMNYILDEDKSIVTNIAGTTRDSVDSYIKYFKNEIRIIDTAGLRRRSKIDDSIEFYSNLRTFKVIDESDVVSVLVDVSKGFDNQDKNIIRYVIDKGKGLIIIINKWDLVDEKETNTMRNLKEDIIYDYPNIKHFPIKFISIKNNFRVGEVLKNMLEVYNKRKSKISTSRLNIILENITRHYSPPSVKGKEIKLKYITQVSIQPPLFVIFTNHPDLIPESYKRYVENKVREECDFFGVPILFSYRKR